MATVWPRLSMLSARLRPITAMPTTPMTGCSTERFMRMLPGRMTGMPRIWGGRRGMQGAPHHTQAGARSGRLGGVRLGRARRETYRDQGHAIARAHVAQRAGDGD